MKRFLSAMALACPLSFATLASAQISAVEGPVPTGPGNVIYGTANVPGVMLSVALEPAGYVEEEYFISGKASSYRHTSSGPERKQTDIPYVTRIIVRRPADSARFSGVVHFEPIHSTLGSTPHWLAINRYLMSRGDIYVAAAVGDADPGPSYPNQTAPVSQSALTKWFDPKRYARLDWPEEDGIRWEVMGDIGKKLRSGDADNPLRAMKVQAMLVGGWSWTGSVQRVFINEGFHDRARLPDGRPAFNGYLIGVSSRWNDPGYLPLYDGEPVPAVGDERRALKQVDAAIVEFLTEFEVDQGKGPQMPDHDGPVGAHRVYELAGVVHLSTLFDPGLPASVRPNVAQLIQRDYPANQRRGEAPGFVPCPLPESDLPHSAFTTAILDNLRHWALDGRALPRAKPLVRNGDKLERDAAGNVLGGIRAAEFEVPLAKYGLYTANDRPNCKMSKTYPMFVRNALSRDELIRRYRTPARYVELYDRQIDRLVTERWLLPEDGLKLKAKARESAARPF